MLYRKIPKNADQLSILGFGCMRLPVKEGKIDEARAIRQIRYAIDKGVNYVDTDRIVNAGFSEKCCHGDGKASGHRPGKVSGGAEIGSLSGAGRFSRLTVIRAWLYLSPRHGSGFLAITCLEMARFFILPNG